MIRQAILRWALARKPDFIIGAKDDPYLLRWFLIPRNPVLNIYVHLFLRSDDDRAMHTHPWLANCSILLEGQYVEHTQSGRFTRITGDAKFRWGAAAHRVELTNGPCWTLFITGPRVRTWGFLCPQGFVNWRDFTAAGDKGAVGKGCDA